MKSCKKAITVLPPSLVHAAGSDRFAESALECSMSDLRLWGCLIEIVEERPDDTMEIMTTLLAPTALIFHDTVPARSS